ncbi:MAG TPA: lysophospholipid acyltransferase family protein [Ktedonobacterales bacterium]
MVYYFVRFAAWVAAHVPRRARLAIAGTFATLVYYLWVAKKRVTIANMATVLGTTTDDPAARRAARNSWRNHGRYISDFLAFSDDPAQARITVLSRLRDVTPPPGAFGLIDEARQGGKGLLIITAHFGAWDIAGILAGSHTPLHVVAEHFNDPRLDKLVEQQRRDLGMEVVWMERSSRSIMRVLQDGGTVAIVADRPMAEGKGVPITFFGKRCYVPGGPAYLALKTGAALMPGYTHYDEEFSEAYYGGAEPYFFAENTGNRDADIAAATQRVYEGIEAFIRRKPEQWHMFRPFWPEAASAPAAPAPSPEGTVAG